MEDNDEFIDTETSANDEIDLTMKELFKYPKTKPPVYNSIDLITNPNEIKTYLNYLLKPNSSDKIITTKIQILNRLAELVESKAYSTSYIDNSYLKSEGRKLPQVILKSNNALVLNAMAKSYSKTPRTDAVQMIIDILFSEKEHSDISIVLREKLLYLLSKLVSGHRFKKKHFEELYEKVLQGKGLTAWESKDEVRTEDDVIQQTLDDPDTLITPDKSDDTPRDSNYYYERILTALEIINIMLTNDDVEDSPNNFIYFNGYNSGISMNKNEFHKGFCFSIWFRLENINFSKLGYWPLLFSFFKEGIGGFEWYFVENQLYYRQLDHKYTEAQETSKGVLIGVFDPSIWNFLSIRHERKFLGRSELKIIINDKKAFAISMVYPKIDKVDKFSHGYIARHFWGQVSTCIIFKGNVNTDKLKKLYQTYPHGLHMKKHLSELKDCKILNDKLLSKIMLIYTPVRATPNVGVWDLIGNHFGSLESNSGVWASEDYKDQLLFWGSLNGLLPLMILIKNRIEKKEHGVELLHKYLEVISKSLKSISGQDTLKETFIKGFFVLLEKLPRDFIHIKTIGKLDGIRYASPNAFFSCLVRSTDIWINCSTAIQKEFWRLVSDIYLDDPKYFHNIFSVQELIDYTLRLSEIKESTFASTPKIGSGTLKDIREDSGMQELSLILNLVEKLLTKGGENMSENIKHLIPILTSKASANFKFEILKLLKVLLIDSKEDSLCPSPLTFAEHFIDNFGMHILLYLCTNSSLNVTIMCIKLIDVLSSLMKPKKLSIDTGVIPFLSSIIISKFKDKPLLYTPFGEGPKKFELLPKIDEEIKSGVHDDDIYERSHTTDDFLMSQDFALLEDAKSSKRTMKLGLEVNVDEANKHFDFQSKNRFQTSDEFMFSANPDEEEKIDSRKPSKPHNYQSGRFMQSKEFLDNTLMKTTKEVPPGPKSKSVPRNNDFFSSEKVDKSHQVYQKKRKSNFDFLGSKNDSNDNYSKGGSSDIMIESGAPFSKPNIKNVIKKRFAFLDTTNNEDDQEEEKQTPAEHVVAKSKPLINHGTTGATEPQSDTSSERSEMLNFNKKNSFIKPTINTDAINEMFTFGGEKGEILMKLDEDEENEKFMKELDEIASICVAAMNRESPEDEIIVEFSESNSKKDEQEYTYKPLKKKKDYFNTPQTLRGVTKIEFSLSKEDDVAQLEKPLKSYLQQDIKEIKEEPSPVGTSASNSSKYDLNTPTSTLGLDTPKTLIEKAVLEEFNFLLIWFNLVKYSSDLIKQKALQAFQMLAKLNKSNCTNILESKLFYPWILDLLLPYQEKIMNNITLSGSVMAVYDIGWKLHTIVILHSLVNKTEITNVLYLARWPLTIQYSEKLENKIGHKVECAYHLIKHLLWLIIKEIKSECAKCRPSIDQPIWANVASLIFIVEELAFNGKPTNIIFKEGYKSIYDDFAQIINLLMTNESSKNSLGNHEIEQYCIIEQLFKVLDCLWTSSLFYCVDQSETKEGKIFNVLSRISDDDFAKDIELLMYSGSKEKKIGSSKSSDIFIRSIVNLVCLKISQIQNQHKNNNKINIQFYSESGSGGDNSAQSTKLLDYWLDIILRIAKFLLLTSETWTSKDINYYKVAQKKIAESLGYIIVFLYRQILVSTKKEITKSITSCLEEIITNLLVTAEYSEIKYTPQQLKQTNHKTASREVLYNILVIDDDIPLITQSQKESLRSNNYTEVSQTLFNLDEWREVIMNSVKIEEIIDRHISSEILEHIDNRKRNHAKNTVQIESTSEASMNKIANKIHEEILEVVVNVSEQLFDIKNKCLLKNEEIRRLNHYSWHNICKELVLYKGVWRERELFDKDQSKIPTTVSTTSVNGISHPLLEPQTEHSYWYFDQKLSDQCMGNNTVSSPACLSFNISTITVNFLKNDAFDIENTTPHVPNVQNNRSGSKGNYEIKIFSKGLSDREIESLSSNFITYWINVDKKLKPYKEYDWDMISLLYFRSGKVVVTSNELMFFDDLKSISSKSEYDESSSWKANLEFIKYKKKEYSPLKKVWSLSDIIMVHNRTFLSKNSSVEIYFYKQKPLMLHFNTVEQRDSFSKYLYKYRDKKDLFQMSHGKFLVNNGRKTMKELKITEKWMNWEISNFEYLMYLNIYSNRSFNDLSHYPVFPWIHLNSRMNSNISNSIESCMRDLTKNMGQLGTRERLEEFIRKYEEGDWFQNDFYHYGSHYSHPGIVLHYLIRLHPFTEGCKALQGGQYDVADRLFYSINNAIENALTDISDVREIIPEFFFMPEMFLQNNGIKLGKTQSGKEVNEVTLPDWWDNDPYKYVFMLKKLLESEQVSYTINQWIDLIYGFKQRGPEAVKAINVYPHYTYDQTSDKNEEDENKIVGQEAKVSQAYNFGQTPSLMFKEAHKQRKSKNKALKYNLIVDRCASIRPYRPVDNQRSVVIFYSKFIDHKKILTLTREKTIKSFNLRSKSQSSNPSSPFTIEASYEKSLPENYVSYLDSFNLKDNTFQILDEVELLLGKGTHVVRGGLWNGEILICNVENGKLEVIDAHTSTVTCITVDDKDKLAVSGSKKGDVIFWEIGQDKHVWTKTHHFYHHEDFVTSITIKDSLVLTSSLDCTINLYNMLGKLIRTFHHPKRNPVFTAIYSNSPLPWVVFFSYRDKVIYSYSVNGKFLSSWSEKDDDPLKCPIDSSATANAPNLKYDLIRSPKIVSDSQFNDHLIYGTDKGTIMIRSLPYLDDPRYSLVASGHSILTLLASADRRFLLVGTTVGGLRILTDPRLIES